MNYKILSTRKMAHVTVSAVRGFSLSALRCLSLLKRAMRYGFGNHKKIQVLAAISLFGLVDISNAAPQTCRVSGEPLQWAADYCMYLLGTDDFVHPKVTACMQKQKNPSPSKSCAAKIQYKKSICAIVVKNGSYQGSLTACVEDKDFMGPSVRNDGF